MASQIIKYSGGQLVISETYRELRSDVDGDWIKARNHALAVLGTSGCINTEITEFNGKISKIHLETVREGDIALAEEVRVVVHSFEDGQWKIVFDKTLPLKTPSIEFEVNVIVKNYIYIAVCPHVRASFGEVTWYIIAPLVYYEPLEPKFSITNVRLDKYDIIKGEPVKVYAEVSNDGNVGGTAQIRVTVDGRVVKTDSVYVEAGTCRGVSYTIEGLPVGSHQICVDLA